jgi:hypothetical protein
MTLVKFSSSLLSVPRRRREEGDGELRLTAFNYTSAEKILDVRLNSRPTTHSPLDHRDSIKNGIKK